MCLTREAKRSTVSRYPYRYIMYFQTSSTKKFWLPSRRKVPNNKLSFGLVRGTSMIKQLDEKACTTNMSLIKVESRSSRVRSCRARETISDPYTWSASDVNCEDLTSPESRSTRIKFRPDMTCQLRSRREHCSPVVSIWKSGIVDMNDRIADVTCPTRCNWVVVCENCGSDSRSTNQRAWGIELNLSYAWIIFDRDVDSLAVRSARGVEKWSNVGTRSTG